jgi:adenylate kinase family enzyme
MMKRILIIGCGGAGKSTLARQLGLILGIDVIHLDSLYWRAGWIESPKSDWQSTVSELLKRDEWIMDGNYGGTLNIRSAQADTVVLLDLPRIRRLFRVLKRRIQYRGRSRPDMAPDCPEKIDWEFLKWVWNYSTTSRPSVMEKIRTHADGKATYLLRSSREVNDFIQLVRRQSTSSLSIVPSSITD